MKLSTASILAIIATSATINAAPTSYDSSIEKGADTQELSDILAEISTYKTKRDAATNGLSKREYEIVTNVLSALNNSGLAPKIIKYLATDSTLRPIAISTIVTVLKSGLLDLDVLFKALDESNLVGQTIEDLISDCSLYVSLFNIAKNYISNLTSIAKQKIQGGVTDFISKRDISAVDFDEDLDKRDLDSIVVNLMESLANSGLASSVVKSIITDPDYIPFAISLINAVLQSRALNLNSIISALKESNLADDLLKQFLNVDTFKTITTNAFAAFAGKCQAEVADTTTSSTLATDVSGSDGTSYGSSGGSYGSSSGNKVTNPCRRKRRRSYNY